MSVDTRVSTLIALKNIGKEAHIYRDQFFYQKYLQY